MKNLRHPQFQPVLLRHQQSINDRLEAHAGNNRLGNRLAEGITMSYESLSAIVPADEYKSAFSCYLHLLFFIWLWFLA